MEQPVTKRFIVKFAYSGSSKREFFEKEFEVHSGENLSTLINDYVKGQNAGEAKSDRIRYWSQKRIPNQ